MDFEAPFIILAPIAWIAFWVGASILYRRSKGKPVFPRVPDDAVFAEAWRSGSSQQNLLTRLSGARNCLLVYVAHGELTIVPAFPFTLMFLPEIYGLEVTAPISTVRAGQIDGLFGKRLALAVGDQNFELWLNAPQRFMEALQGKTTHPAHASETSKPRPKIGWRVRFFQIFALIWGAGACFGGFTGLSEDLRFRSNGAVAVGKFVEPAREDAASSRNGTVQYVVGGRSFTLSSIQGSGLYKIGAPDTVRYLPANPATAREDGYLGFDMLFACMGSIMLTLGLSMGWVVKRVSGAMNLG